MKTQPRTRSLLPLAPALLTFAALAALAALTPLSAEEGGSGHYLMGTFSTMFDFPPEKPGTAIGLQFISYSADVESNVTLPSGGLLPLGLKADTEIAVILATHTFETKVLGGHYTVGAGIPIVDLKVAGTIGGFRTRQSDSGISDVMLLPIMLQWRRELWQYGVIGAIYAPTGGYDAGRIANVGKNYWTFEPTIGATYLNPKNLLEFTALAGVDINTENTDTDYRSGSQGRIEASVVKHFSRGTALYGLGLTGFYYQQLTGDSGSGATLGDFKGMSTGLGPVISYVSEGKTGSSFIEIKWLPELDTKNRLEGDYIWVKTGISF